MSLDNLLLAALAFSCSEWGFRIAPVEIPFSQELDWFRRWKASRQEGFQYPLEVLSVQDSAPLGVAVARFQVTKRLVTNIRVSKP